MDFNAQIDELLKKHKRLSINAEKNELVGELFISEFDSYEVCIDLSPYPRLFPIVYEIGERIPKKVHRHIYTDSNSCCFTTNAKAQILLKTKITSLLLFIDQIVIPYLENNSFYEINNHYKTKEYSHDSLGIIESYRDILKTANDLNIAILMQNRLNNEKLKIHYYCYCGSKVKLKKCTNRLHDKCHRDFRKIDKSIILNDLEKHFIPHLQNQGLIPVE